MYGIYEDMKRISNQFINYTLYACFDHVSGARLFG